MPSFSNMKQLEQYVNQMAKESMLRGNSVKNMVIDTGERHVQSDVYDVYSPDPNNPKSYKRTGLLKESWEVEETLNGIEIYNSREDEGRNIPEIIETGKGYQFNFEYNGKPRPFIENTLEELRRRESELTDALRQDMKANGLNVK